MTADGNPDDQRKRIVGKPLNDADPMRRLADAVWELLLDQLLSIPEVGNLTLTHLRLLYWIRDRQPVTLPEIHRECGIPQPVAVRMTGKLIKRGLLSRCGDLFDRHAVYLYLSDTGLLLLTRMDSCQQQGVTRILSQLASREHHQFSDEFDRILDYKVTDGGLLADEQES